MVAGHLKAGALLTVGNAVGAASSFVRNIIVARLVSVDDFGIAATFAMVMALIEMSSNLAVDRLIVQDQDGDDPSLQSSAQLFLFLRGVINSVILFAVAGPTAEIFGIPQVVWAYQVLALIPLITGFSHLDRIRSQRAMQFGKTILVDVGPHIFVTALAAPLALYLDDYRVMLWLVLIQAVSITGLSHVVATRKYKWEFNRKYMLRIYHFGWPLLIDGFLMFGIFQGDRLLVGAFFDMNTLGWFSAAFSVTLVPSLLIVKICASFLLPLLSRVQGDAEKFQQRCMETLQVNMLLGCLFAVACATIGPSAFILVYGQQYAGGLEILAWLGLMQGIRIARIGPIIIALSVADTKNSMYTNLARSSAFLLALLAVYLKAGVVGIVASAVVGEVIAFAVSMILLEKKTEIGFGSSRVSVLLIGIIMAAAMIVSKEYLGTYPAYIELIAGILFLTGASVACLLVMPELACSLGDTMIELNGQRKFAVVTRVGKFLSKKE